MSLPVAVDVEALAVAYLGTRAELTNIVGTRIGSALAHSLPALQLSKLGGTFVDDFTGHLERARILGAAWAVTKPGANELARLACRAWLEMPDAGHALGVVTAAAIELTPYWSPDPEDATPRYLFTLALWAHPSPP